MRGRGEGEAIAPMIVLLLKNCSSHADENLKLLLCSCSYVMHVMLMSRLITKLECVQIREKPPFTGDNKVWQSPSH